MNEWNRRLHYESEKNESRIVSFRHHRIIERKVRRERRKRRSAGLTWHNRIFEKEKKVRRERRKSRPAGYTP